MRNPQTALAGLIARGKPLAREAEAITRGGRGLDDKLHLGMGVVNDLIGLTKYKRMATAAARTVLQGGLETRYTNLANAFEQWFNEGLRLIRSVSVATKNITPRGNSATLVGRLVRAMEPNRLGTRIVRTLGVLEAIAALDLVYNEDIPELLRQRRQEAMEERRLAREAKLLDLSDLAPGMELVKLQNREHVRTTFAAHPEVGRMMEGALDAYASTRADAYRQALSSCRNALQLLVREVAGEVTWGAGVALLVEGSRKRLINDTWAFLSGYGSHPGGKPTKKDAAYGIRMTMASCLWLLELPG